MGARPIDAAEGYRLYREHHGKVGLDEINEFLRGKGLRPVSPRMALHYGRLFKHGYSEYIPINRFDVALSRDYAWSEDLRARYPELRESIAAELTVGGSVLSATVESLGEATASVLVRPAPRAGRALVLRLLTTGISRTGSVVRSDPPSGRVHIAFDLYSSVVVAPSDSPVRAAARIGIPAGYQSLAVTIDSLLRIQAVLEGWGSSPRGLLRVQRMSLNSPLELVVIGGVALKIAVGVAKNVMQVRREYYEGLKTKFEAEGLDLDNEQKRRGLQLEADAALVSEIEAEGASEDETPLLDRIQTSDMPNGAAGSDDRRLLTETAKRAVELPPTTQLELDPEPATGPGGDSTAG